MSVFIKWLGQPYLWLFCRRSSWCFRLMASCRLLSVLRRPGRRCSPGPCHSLPSSLQTWSSHLPHWSPPTDLGIVGLIMTERQTCGHFPSGKHYLDLYIRWFGHYIGYLENSVRYLGQYLRCRSLFLSLSLCMTKGESLSKSLFH